jgi:diguanylate cyclase (GGDEF)-like protein
LILLDLDHFKRYNDEHGHLAGDAALGRVGAILTRVVRGGDRVFRFGGEEFLILLPEVSLTETVGIAERIRESVERDHLPGVPDLTVSAGVALNDPADGRDPAPLLRRADKALYLAKRGGRNRIEVDELSSALQREEMVVA